MLTTCIGSVWQSFGSDKAAEVASVRRRQKLPLCPTEPVPAGSKMEPLLAKLELISDGGSTSVKTYVRMGKKTCAAAVRRKE